MVTLFSVVNRNQSEFVIKELYVDGERKYRVTVAPSSVVNRNQSSFVIKELYVDGGREESHGRPIQCSEQELV